MEHWGERSTDSVFKVKQRRKIRRFFQVHILFMVIYGQPSCFTTIAASYLHWGEGGREKVRRRDFKKKKRKENESLQYHLKPLGVSLYHFSSCTDLEWKPILGENQGPRHFFASCAPRIQKHFRKKEIHSSFGHPNRATKSLYWTSASGIHFWGQFPIEINLLD